MPPQESNSPQNVLPRSGTAASSGPEKGKDDAPHPRLALLQQQLYQGPIPPPEYLEGYERIVPGAAKRLLDMAAAESEHRRTNEGNAADAQIESLRRADKDGHLGLWLAFILAMTIVLGSIVCILTGHELGGSVLGGVTVTGLVGAFIAGRPRKSK